MDYDVRTAKSWKSPSGFDMKTKSKIWIGVGAFVVVGTGATSATGLLAAQAAFGRGARPDWPTDAAISSTDRTVVAQHAGHGPEAGEAGETKNFAALPPHPPLAPRLPL